MATGFTAARAAALSAHAVGKTADTMPTQIWAGLATSAGTGGTETTYSGYARQQIHAADLNAASVVSGVPTSSNANAISFPAPSSGSATITTVLLFTTSTGGSAFAALELSNSFITNAATPLVFDPGSFVVTLPETTGLAEYAALKLLDHALGKTAWTMPTSVQMDLLKTAWDGHSAFTTYLATYTSYAAVLTPGSSIQTPTNTAPSLTITGVDIVYPVNTGSAEAEAGWALRDGSGNGLCYGTLSGTVNVGIAPKIPTSTQILTFG
jgi:hypothetical protein